MCSTHVILPRTVSAVRPRRHTSLDPKPGGRKPCPHGPMTFSTEAPGHTSQAPGQWPEDLGAVTADTNRWTRGFYTPGQRVLPRCLYNEERSPSPDQSFSRNLANLNGWSETSLKCLLLPHAAKVHARLCAQVEVPLDVRDVPCHLERRAAFMDLRGRSLKGRFGFRLCWDRPPPPAFFLLLSRQRRTSYPDRSPHRLRARRLLRCPGPAR